MAVMTRLLCRPRWRLRSKHRRLQRLRKKPASKRNKSVVARRRSKRSDARRKSVSASQRRKPNASAKRTRRGDACKRCRWSSSVWLSRPAPKNSSVTVMMAPMNSLPRWRKMSSP